MVVASILFVLVFILELFGYSTFMAEIDCSTNNTRQEALYCLANGAFEAIFGIYGKSIFNFTLVAVSIYLVWYFYNNKSVIKQNYGSKLGHITAKILAILLISTLLIFIAIKFI
jgi:hypothetical protein